ncbi:MAG: DUF2975 domain-containing protein [Pikeienuella sp.]
MAILQRIFGYLIAAILLFLFVQNLLIFCIGWGTAFMGDYQMVADYMDQDRPIGEPPVWKLLIGVVFSVLFLGAVGVVVWSLNRLRINVTVEGLASAASARALRRTGQGLVAIWIAILLLDYILPMIFYGSRAAEPEWVVEVLSLDILLAFVGAVLISVAGVAEEAAALRDENQQFI